MSCPFGPITRNPEEPEGSSFFNNTGLRLTPPSSKVIVLTSHTRSKAPDCSARRHTHTIGKHLLLTGFALLRLLRVTRDTSEPILINRVKPIWVFNIQGQTEVNHFLISHFFFLTPFFFGSPTRPPSAALDLSDRTRRLDRSLEPPSLTRWM